jgi:hypothetical protein
MAPERRLIGIVAKRGSVFFGVLMTSVGVGAPEAVRW